MRQVQNFAVQPRPGPMWLATVLLFAILGLAFAGTEALAASPATGDTASAPSPDPKPLPKPDPKPPKPPPPPPPPPPSPPPPPPPPPAPAPARTGRVAKPKRAVTPTPPAAARPKVTRHKAPARVAAPRARPRPKAHPPKPKVERVKKARHEARGVLRRKPEMQNASRATLARETLNLNGAPPSVFARRDSPLSSALPVVVPLVGLGLALLLGVSVASARRIPWPAVAEPLYEHRINLAAVGFGAIAIALLLLWLNVIVLF